MKKSKTTRSSEKGFRKDINKLYVRKFRVYPSFLYSRLDRWLKAMSLKGLHVVHCDMLSFWFEKGLPKEKEYFTYGLATQEGKYNISLKYPLLEKTYGVKSKNSKINSNDKKTYKIVEIDTTRIAVQNDAGYKELITDRNHLYLRYFIRNSTILALSIITLIILFTFF